MVLSPESQAVAKAVAEILPEPMHKLGVDGARAFADKVRANARPGPDVAYVEDRVIDDGNGPVPVRIYRNSDQPNLPILIYFHGGGWVVGHLDAVDANCRKLSIQANAIVVSVGYRQAPEHKFPAALEDAYSVVDWVFDNGDSIGGDPARIAVGGESAGANLAAVAALYVRDSGRRLRFQFLVTPPTEYPAGRPSLVENANAPVMTTADALWFVGQYLPSEAERSDPRFAPSLAADLSGLPPAFILSAEHDPLRDDAENYAKLLAAAGVDVVMKRYPGVFHGFFGMGGIIPQADEAMRDAVELLQKYLA